MKRFGKLLVFILVVAANAVILSGVAYNRSGEPDSAIHLTERELSVSRSGEENSGISLSLRWAVQGYWLDGPGWFGREKLEEIGFYCGIPLDDPLAGTRYRNMLSRETFVVLEYEGAAWQEWLAHEEEELVELAAQVESGENTRDYLERQRKNLAILKVTSSRLFVVEVGNRPDELRDQFPDGSRYIITAALVRMRTIEEWDEETDEYRITGLRGGVSRILAGEIHVSRSMRLPLDEILVKDEEAEPGRFRRRTGEPRFTASLAYGKRYEPWLTGIQPIEKPGTQ